MRSENEIIILLSRLTMEDRDYQRIPELFHNGIDWGYFIYNCVKNQVISLVYRNMRKYNLLVYMDRTDLKIMKSVCEFSYTSTEVLKREMSALEILFAENGIKHAFIKGGALEEKVYGKCGLCRDYNDIDILIGVKDITRVVSLLKANGYIHGDYDEIEGKIIAAKRSEIITMQMCSHQLYPLVKMIGNLEIEVDVNFTVFEGGNVPLVMETDVFLDATDRIVIPNAGCVNTLNATYMFIQLIFHLYKDLVRKRSNIADLNEFIGVKLLNFCDIREFTLAYASAIDFEYIRSLHNNTRLLDAIYIVFDLISDVYGGERLIDIDHAPCDKTRIVLNEMKRNIYKRLFFDPDAAE
jgi:hypothetical protein